MSDIYLPVRAFGDFTITTAVIKNHFAEKMPVILPNYLKQLYDVLNASDYYEVVDTIDLNRSTALFEVHKIKKAGDGLRLVNEILTINHHLKRGNNYLLDYSSKRLNVFFKKFTYPAKTGNIYQTKIQLLEKHLTGKDTAPLNPRINNYEKVVIFPGSRKASKVVDPELVKMIISSGMFKNVGYAYHQSENPPDGAIVFNNFDHLKNIILDNDLVISADSLPLHLAYFFNKPHFGIYNKTLNEQWVTPFLAVCNYHTVFNVNVEEAFRDIQQKLTGKPV